MTEPKITPITRFQHRLDDPRILQSVEALLCEEQYQLIYQGPLVLGRDIKENLYAHGHIVQMADGMMSARISECSVRSASANGRAYSLFVEIHEHLTLRGQETLCKHESSDKPFASYEAIEVAYGQVITINGGEVRIWAPPGTDTYEENPWPEKLEESVANNRTTGNDDQQGQASAETGATPDSGGRDDSPEPFVIGGDHDERSSGGDGWPPEDKE